MVDRSRLGAAVLAVALLLAVGIVAVAINPGLLPTGEYERTTVDVVDAEDGEPLATVTVRVADTRSKRYTGLSDTDSLGPDEGMLFVHDEEDEYAYVMREMAFPIDIVFVDAEGRITTIHRAELPSEGTSGDDLERYRGRGRYVLEVPYNYTDDHGIEVGDRVRIDGEWGPPSNGS
ncbi:DUF192 domain-containing protein [Halobellus limi]|uniref:DUF192 domain-containing protein n=1 Tax=Halobellus limi TaxID=699433 RepID=A0A1H6C1C6_9EURY|nr:DUF192 domain-containing protein [Halobellus limi]QCC48528.1 DUF192 domain-containing protein [Halobellus limi]SEG66663.1 hypothetical protein SAMN04488133_3119 [Halobellus limi]